MFSFANDVWVIKSLIFQMCLLWRDQLKKSPIEHKRCFWFLMISTTQFQSLSSICKGDHSSSYWLYSTCPIFESKSWNLSFISLQRLKPICRLPKLCIRFSLCSRCFMCLWQKCPHLMDVDQSFTWFTAKIWTQKSEACEVFSIYGEISILKAPRAEVVIALYRSGLRNTTCISWSLEVKINCV